MPARAPKHTRSRPSDRDTELLDRALARFDSVAMPQAEMRAQALEARRFVTIPGAMWEGQWGEQWENTPRPEIDKITKSLEKIETDYRENRLTADFVPANDAADEDTAETLDGMHRADSYHFKSMQARDNAFQEAIRGGFGAYRLTTELANPDDPEDESQRVNPGMVIVDADQSVYFDGASKLYDKSDAQWAFVIVADPPAVVTAQWGNEALADFPIQGFKYAYDWYTPDVVRTAEYYEVEHVAEKRLTFTNKLTEETQIYWEGDLEADQIAELKATGWKKSEKPGKRKRVHKYIINGARVLKDCGIIAGDRIPVVPVYGRRDFVDNMERFRGHVHKKMDRQRLYNASVAKVAETQALAPYEVPIVAPEQIDGYIDGAPIAQHWAEGNISRKPFRVLLPLRNEDGSIAAAGPIGKIEPPQVQPGTAALLQITSSDLTDDDQNADEVKANTSADAMDIAASRVDSKSAIYLDNMRQSIQLEAEIYLGMAREVYYEPSRRVETLSMDGKDGTATLMEAAIGKDGVYRIRNDLTRGRYKVVADVQESTSTKRQKAVRESLNIAEVALKAQVPQLAQAALITAVLNQDGEGMQDFQAFTRNMGIGIGLVKPSDEEKQQLEQAAEQQKQPTPSDQLLIAQTGKLAAETETAKAKAVDTLASAQLKTAQAEAVGGPVSEPDKPSGLSAPEVQEREASANLKTAQAEKIRHEIGEKRVRMGHEIEMDRRDRDIAERTPAGNA